MAAAIVYDGVEGKYEGSLFNGIKFWVAQRVPTRSSIVGKIKDNGGKIVLLEKHADVLIADHARKDCPAGSVSWKYIEESVARGELLDIGDYRIHAANIPRAVGSTRPTKGTRVPFTELDERILVTWVRRAGADALGNRIYQELAEMYPHHTWQSWRDKWVKKFSFLSEDQLPPLLQELPPSKPRPPGGGSRSTPHTASPPTVPVVNQPDVDPIPGSRPAGAKRGRVAFTKEDDRLLVEYVMQRMMAGKSPGGNVIYQELENEYPHHTAHAWRDRYLRYLSRRELPEELNLRGFNNKPSKSQVKPIPPAEPSTESPRPRTRPAVPISSYAPSQSLPTQPGSLWNHATATKPLLPPPPSPSPPSPSPSPPPPPPPPTSNLASAVASADTQRLKILKELRCKKERITAARKIQHAWRARRLQRKLKSLLAIARFQARAQGFLTRRCLGMQMDEFKDSTNLPESDQAQTEMKPEENEMERELNQEDMEPSEIQNEARSVTPHRVEENVTIRTNRGQDAASTPRSRVTPILPREEFWRNFNVYNKLNDVNPMPWVQAGDHTVDCWDLWRCVTAEPDHTSRDWEVIAENLGFDWIAEPHIPAHLKVAFEKYMLGFEEALREFNKWEEEGEAEEEEEEKEEKEEDEEEGYSEGFGITEVMANKETEPRKGQKESSQYDEVWAEATAGDEDKAAPQALDDNFVSSPPLLGVKRARLPSTSPFHSSVRKRPRYDVTSEIPETPDTRTDDAGQGATGAGDSAAAINLNQQTPTRGPRHAAPARQRIEVETQLPPPPGEYNGAISSDPPTPSRQLLSESELVTSQAGPRRTLSAVLSSPKKPLPSIEYDEENESGSSDAFESVSNLPVGRSKLFANRDENRPRRILPWFTNKSSNKAKHSPIRPTDIPQSQPRRIITTTTTTTTITTTATAAAANPNDRVPSSSAAPTFSPFPQLTQKRTVINPTPLMSHFLAQKKYPPKLIARAVMATTCQFAHTETVLDSLTQGRGIPPDIPGVWTEEEDRELRRIGGWVDALHGRMPRRSAEAAAAGAGGGEEGEGGAVRFSDEREKVFWQLVDKHGSERVFWRREFLNDFDKL